MLSFDYPDASLETQLKSTTPNWELLVKIASQHLVLTSVYCRLQQKKLLYLLPKDLVIYLAELTAINRNRNKTIAKEVKWIGKLLNENQIEHLFFKGAGLLMGGYYKDFGERMIGDIDVLLRSKDKKRAFELLAQNGYDHSIGFNYDRKDFRHLPRQINNEKMAAVEIHDNVLLKSHRHLIDLDLVFDLSAKQNKINIASKSHLNLINILTTQVNNFDYYYNQISFKSVYDTMVLGYKDEGETINYVLNNRYVNSYMDLYAFWNTNNQTSLKNYCRQIRTKTYAVKISSARLEAFIYRAKKIYWNVTIRISLFLNNHSYRKHILKDKIFVKS